MTSVARAQSKSELTQFHTRTKSFNNTFFPFCIKEWNKLDAKIICRTDENSIFEVDNLIGIRLFNGLRLNFSHLNEHKFRYNFRDTAD